MDNKITIKELKIKAKKAGFTKKQINFIIELLTIILK